IIVVADGKDQFFGKDPVKSVLTEAVFGDEIVQYRNGEAHLTFARNGFWHGSAGARNRNVSGVILLADTGLWKLGDPKRQPTLAVNPWARHRVPESLRSLRRFESDNDLWVLREGQKLADIVKLPNPWPPEEASTE